MPPARPTDAIASRSPLRWATVVLIVAVLSAACSSGSGDDDASVTQPTVPRSTAASSQTTTGGGRPEPSTSATATTGPAPGTPLRCELVERTVGGDVARAELIETSGLVASRRHDEVLWATNDSGQEAGLFAIDLQGRDLGFFSLVDDGAPVPAADIEDLAIGDDTIYLADIGDNGRRRDTVLVFAAAEPQPGADGSTEVDAVVEFRYPDGPTDAEALLVDEAAGELIVLSKNLDAPLDPTRIYTVPLDGGAGPVIEAIPAGTLDVAALTADSDGFSFNTLLFPGSVTGADLSPDGTLIALRTYGSVWLFTRRPDQSVAEALTSAQPCEIGSAAETQGEAVALLDGPDDAAAGARTIRSVTVSEGENPPVNLAVAVLDP